MDGLIIVFIFVFGLAILTLALLLACVLPALRHALHMYQQNSYQNRPHRRWLGANRPALLGWRRVAPMALCAAIMTLAPSPGLLMLCWAASVTFLALNRKPKAAKKPLVYTPRIKRLMVTAGALTAALFVFGGYVWFYPRHPYSGPLAALLMCAWVLAQPWLVMVYAALNSPMERAINRRYVREARDILARSPRLTVIGLTGSYGKTSTKTFLEQLLSVKYNVYSTPGNYNTTLGVVRAVREGLRPTHDIFLCEMGARHVGDIAEICDLVQPKMGLITYIGAQHLETFGSQQAITDTKLELARAVEHNGGALFVNWDSPIAAGQAYGGDLTRYGADAAADYRVSDVSVSDRGSAFTVTAPDGQSASFHTRLLGSANVGNITGAIAVAHRMGIPLAELVPAVRGLRGAPHRLELKPGVGMTLIDDAYNSNPLGASIALDTLARCRGSRILVTPGLVELGTMEAQANRAVGAQAAQCADYVVVVGRRPGDSVAAGALEAGLDAGRLHRAATIGDALAHVAALPLPQRFVLLLNDLPDNYS